MSHEEIDAPVPVVDLSKIPNDPNTPKCVGCGSWHGPTNVLIQCLEATIARLRAEAKSR